MPLMTSLICALDLTLHTLDILKLYKFSKTLPATGKGIQLKTVFNEYML